MTEKRSKKADEEKLRGSFDERIGLWAEFKKFKKPRPDYRWVPGEGRRLHEPTRVPKRLPAPPLVPVEVPEDIADTVREYALALSRWYDVTARKIKP